MVCMVAKRGSKAMGSRQRATSEVGQEISDEIEILEANKTMQEKSAAEEKQRSTFKCL